MEVPQIDFFVVGAARSGTTSLYNYLKQHPEIFLPNIKELNFFSQVTSNSREDYKKPKKNTHYHNKIIQSMEVYSQLFEAAGPHQKKGDISPSYLWKADTVARIKQHNPNAKIMVTLRNPIQRAYSHYIMNFSVGYDRHGTFGEALEGKKNNAWGGGNLYLEWSSYYQPLKAYLDAFGKENVLILVFEEWVRDRKNTMERICQFLEVNPTVEIDLSEKHNKKVAYKNINTLNFLRGSFVKQLANAFFPSKTKDRLKEKLFGKEEVHEPLDATTAIELQKYFKEEVKNLQKLTGIPLQTIWGFTNE